MRVADAVYDAIKPLFVEDIKLVEVEYAKKNNVMHLTIYIDKENGVTIEDCENVSHMVDNVLEELNPTGDEQYYLDVSSYGLDKPLKYDWQFKKYYGKKVNVKLYRKVENRKEFVAELISKNDDTVTLCDDKENFSIKLSEVAFITPYIEF